jgi:hypothetical protein
MKRPVWGANTTVRRSALQDDLDIDAVGDLDPHHLAERPFVGVDVDEPPPSGPLRTGTRSRFVGRGIGPAISTPVRWVISRIWRQTESTLRASMPLKEMRAF